MSSRNVRLVRSLCLSAAFVVTVFSAFGHHAAGAGSAHGIAGGLLLLGTIPHLRSNRAWMRNARQRGSAGLPERPRALWRTDRALLGAALACALPLPMLLGNFGFAGHLAIHAHQLGGAAMIVLLTIHLFQHRGWLASTLRALPKMRQSAAG